LKLAIPPFASLTPQQSCGVLRQFSRRIFNHYFLVAVNSGVLNPGSNKLNSIKRGSILIILSRLLLGVISF
ncbi:MAG TPA: hypothetical protein VJI98_04230, partial [Candidatus Nanoarchaeia archaeon]|nr:hypothetical protein [Candidatus Nanoarchaeia archaeon]